MKKKTHEEYVEELAIKNPVIEVIGEYINTNTKIMHHCLKHDVYWEIRPANILMGQGCEFCRREKLKNFHSKTHEDYVNELNKVNSSTIVIEKYRGASIPILHECTKHNIQWKISPSDVLYGRGCVKCKGEKIHKRLSKTHEQYVQELAIKNPNIVVMENYIGADTHILHRCLIDNYEWKARPSNLLNGHCGCPKCSQRFRRTHESYVEEVSLINPHINVIDKFIDMRTPILHHCLIHDVTWKTSPSSIIYGCCGCPKCGNEKVSKKLLKTHDQYVEELNNVNPNIKVIGKYMGANTPILHKCLIDDYEWITTPASLLYRTGCPKCNESKGERRIRIWLDNNNIDYIHQHKYEDCKDIKPLPFDFYLPKFNVLVEYDGEQHFRPIEYFGGQEKFELQQKHDAIKNEYCKNNGIPLLRIPYYKYDDIEEELNNFLFI